MKKVTDSAPKHLRFAVLAADVALFTVFEKNLLVRLIKVKRPPYFPNSKGMPGGLIRPNETAEGAALRLIEEKGGVGRKKIYIEQFHTFSKVKRDPRGRVVAVAYFALVPWQKLSEKERGNSVESWWHAANSKSKLAYDHNEMLELALKRVQSRIKYTTAMKHLMPEEFTLTELEKMYELILDKKLDKRNFRKKILSLKILKPLPAKRTGKFRPAQLYKFRSAKVEEIQII